MQNTRNLFYVFKFKAFISYEMNQFNTFQNPTVKSTIMDGHPIKFRILFCVHLVNLIHFMNVLPNWGSIHLKAN